MTGLLLCDDFFFANKITGTAEALGLRIREVTTPAEALRAVAEETVRFVVVDLSLGGLNLRELFAALPAENRPAVIAFDSHVHAQRMQAAREAGCDEVLPKSRFSAELPQLLQRFGE